MISVQHQTDILFIRLRLQPVQNFTGKRIGINDFPLVFHLFIIQTAQLDNIVHQRNKPAGLFIDGFGKISDRIFRNSSVLHNFSKAGNRGKRGFQLVRYICREIAAERLSSDTFAVFPFPDQHLLPGYSLQKRRQLLIGLIIFRLVQIQMIQRSQYLFGNFHGEKQGQHNGNHKNNNSRLQQPAQQHPDRTQVLRHPDNRSIRKLFRIINSLPCQGSRTPDTLPASALNSFFNLRAV